MGEAKALDNRSARVQNKSLISNRNCQQETCDRRITAASVSSYVCDGKPICAILKSDYNNRRWRIYRKDVGRPPTPEMKLGSKIWHDLTCAKLVPGKVPGDKNNGGEMLER